MVIALSRRGYPVGREAARACAGRGRVEEVRLCVPAAALDKDEEATGDLPATVRLEPLPADLPALIAQAFTNRQALVMVMAVGIAVRLVAPHLRSKTTDPAVVVIDEVGRQAVSLVSGHLGGANELAGFLAASLGAQAVITTASDLHRVKPLDVVLARSGITPEPHRALAGFMGRLLDGGRLWLAVEEGLEAYTGWARDFPQIEVVTGEGTVPPAPEPLMLLTCRRSAAHLQARRSAPTLYLHPRCLAAGVGCRRGVTATEVREAVLAALEAGQYSPLSLAALHTLEAKLAEAGLVEAGRALGVPVRGFSPAQLQSCLERHPELTRSARVQARMGVEGVCEPASLLGAQGAKLLVPKMIVGRVTVALGAEFAGRPALAACLSSVSAQEG